jgi:hypothetical protein
MRHFWDAEMPGEMPRENRRYGKLPTQDEGENG